MRTVRRFSKVFAVGMRSIDPPSYTLLQQLIIKAKKVQLTFCRNVVMFMDPKTNARLPSSDDIYVDYLYVSITSKGHKTKTYEHQSWCRISHLAQNVGLLQNRVMGLVVDGILSSGLTLKIGERSDNSFRFKLLN